jgi:broad specificity phosphatase PhoE
MSGYAAQFKSVYLIRHGEAQNNTERVYASYPEDDRLYHLTDTGRAQVADLCSRLKDEDVGTIMFTSPLTRTIETTQIIQRTTATPVMIDNRLRETDFGPLNNSPYLSTDTHGLDSENIGEVRRQTLDARAAKGSETIDSVRARCEELLKDIAPLFGSETVYIVAHADSIQQLCSLLVGSSVDESLLWYPGRATCRVVSTDGTARTV